MISIRFPEPEFAIKKDNGKDLIFDAIRKKWLVLTPEEWVRQNFVSYLQKEKSYPSAMLALEKELKLGELKKRFDILVYDAAHRPWLMVECKAPEVTLDQKVLEQVLRYNVAIPVEYIIITNGEYTYGWQLQQEEVIVLDDLPGYNGLIKER